MEEVHNETGTQVTEIPQKYVHYHPTRIAVVAQLVTSLTHTYSYLGDFGKAYKDGIRFEYIFRFKTICGT